MVLKEVVVIGAGVAGSFAALRLADEGHRVTIVEAHTVGSGSSSANPGRMGHGFHYADINTAVMYLRASIEVQRKYPRYLIGEDLPFDHPIRHGRYYITRDSDFPPSQILATYQQLQEEYQRLVAEDPKNQVFGPPDQFFRILDPSEYKDDVNGDKVVIGVETREHLFDITRFLVDRREELLQHPNITLCEHTTVTGLSFHLNADASEESEETFYLYDVTMSNGVVISTNCIVNSAWYQIDAINATLSTPSELPFSAEKRTNRLKALAVINLPPSFHPKNSMFFCMGQHCMFSNMGNGTGMLTYAEKTNIEVSSGLHMSERATRLLRGEGSIAEVAEIGQMIIEGASQYMPGLRLATLREVKFGIVQTAGRLTLAELKDPLSSFHKRDYDGVEMVRPGLINNPAIKLFYFIRNGNVVVKLVDEHYRRISQHVGVHPTDTPPLAACHIPLLYSMFRPPPPPLLLPPPPLLPSPSPAPIQIEEGEGSRDTTIPDGTGGALGFF